MISLAAYVYASITTEDEGFAFLLFLADAFTAAAIVPAVPFAS
jgi:hypothetical protein